MGDLLSLLITLVEYVVEKCIKSYHIIMSFTFRFFVGSKFSIGDHVEFTQNGHQIFESSKYGSNGIIVKKVFYYKQSIFSKTVTKSWRYNIKDSETNTINIEVLEENIRESVFQKRDKLLDQLIN